jgi:hypothetical protein
MPLIDPNYLRMAAMGRVNQGLLPAVGDEDYAAMLERLQKERAFNITRKDRPGTTNMLETWPAGEEGTPDYARPEDLPLDQTGIEVNSSQVQPKDIVGDLASHDMAQNDPNMTGYYREFERSLTPEQHARLRDQYQWAQQNEGEQRPYEDWYQASGLPAYFRGGAFKQWDNPDQYYTPEQTHEQGRMLQYLQTGKPPEAESSGLIDQGGLDQGARDSVNVGMLPAVEDPMDRVAHNVPLDRESWGKLPVAGEPEAEPKTGEEKWSYLLRGFGTTPKDPVGRAQATLMGLPPAVRPYVAAGMAPAVAALEIPGALAAAGTSMQRAYSGELPVTEVDPITGESHITPQAAGEGLNAAFVAPAAGAFAAPLEEAAGMGVRTRMRGKGARPGPKPEAAVEDRAAALAQSGTLPKRDDAFYNAPNKDAPFPQYAYDYPPTAPGKLMKKTGGYVGGRAPPGVPWPGKQPSPKMAQKLVDEGKAYWEKVQSPEAKAFEKARNKVKRDMEKEGFTPFYDPAERFDVNPKDYPRAQETAAIRKVQDKPHEDWEKKVNTPENRQRLKDAYFKGIELPDTTDFYLIGQMEHFLKKRYGAAAGRVAMKDFTGRMAATTGGMMPEQNLLLAHFVKWAGARKLNVGKAFATHELPYPIGGGKYGAKNNLLEAGKFQEGKIFGEQNPKRDDFQDAFLGHETFVTDEQMMNAFDYPGRQSAPPERTYGYHTRTGMQAAKEIGVKPRRFQEGGWYGLKDIPGEPFIQTQNKAIERTHRLTGLPRSQIAEGMAPNPKPPRGHRVPALYANRKEAAPLISIMQGKKPKLAVDPVTPKERPIAPTFFSPIEKFVAGSTQSKLPGSQWLGMIKKTPGIKPEEIAQLKLNEVLPGKKMMTKKEMLDYVRANKLQIEEELRGPPPEKPKVRTKKDTSPAQQHEIADLKKRLGFNYRNVEDDLAEALGEESGRKPGDAQRYSNSNNPTSARLIDHMLARPGTITEAERAAAFDTAAKLLRGVPQVTTALGKPIQKLPTLYDKWMKKGGKNYRELQFILPRDKPKVTTRIALIADKIGLDPERISDINLNNAVHTRHITRDDAEHFMDWKIANKKSKGFSTSHMEGKKNLLGWALMKDRVGPNGEKILGVEEIQSDWHQRGRDEGYEGKVVVRDIPDQKRIRQFDTMSEAEAFQKEKGGSITMGTIPDAPLKSTWHKMVMKRLVRWAAEHGYDKLAWMPGEVLNKRYNLSQHVNAMEWSPQMSGHGTVLQTTMRSGGNINMQIVDGKVVSSHPGGNQYVGHTLADIIGKELSEKILSEPNGSLEGLQLDIGGKMQGFYDEMLHTDAKEITGQKVGTTHVATDNKKGRLQGQAIGSDSDGWILVNGRGSRLGSDVYPTRKAAAAALRKMPIPGNTQEMWSIDITPELKERAMHEGFSLPANPKEAAGLGLLGARQDDRR